MSKVPLKQLQPGAPNPPESSPAAVDRGFLLTSVTSSSSVLQRQLPASHTNMLGVRGCSARVKK